MLLYVYWSPVSMYAWKRWTIWKFRKIFYIYLLHTFIHTILPISFATISFLSILLESYEWRVGRPTGWFMRDLVCIWKFLKENWYDGKFLMFTHPYSLSFSHNFYILFFLVESSKHTHILTKRENNIKYLLSMFKLLLVSFDRHRYYR